MWGNHLTFRRKIVIHRTLHWEHSSISENIKSRKKKEISSALILYQYPQDIRSAAAQRPAKSKSKTSYNEIL